MPIYPLGMLNMQNWGKRCVHLTMFTNIGKNMIDKSRKNMKENLGSAYPPGKYVLRV